MELGVLISVLTTFSITVYLNLMSHSPVLPSFCRPLQYANKLIFSIYFSIFAHLSLFNITLYMLLDFSENNIALSVCRVHRAVRSALVHT